MSALVPPKLQPREPIFLSLLSVGVAQGSPRRRSGGGGYHPHSYPHSYDSRRRFDSRGGGDGDGGGIPCEGSCRTWVAGGAMVIMLGTIVGVLAWATSNARREAREPEIDRMNSGIAMTDSFVQNPATGAGVELPTGLWKGHYSGSDGLKHKVEFNLKFEDGVVQGDGLDDVGVYSIQGRYQGDRISFVKKYVKGSRNDRGQRNPDNEGHSVKYEGQQLGHVSGIRGSWSLRNQGTNLDGQFHLWPAAAPSAPPS